MEERKEEMEKKMHIVMVPWLAMGHIIPFHQLSICLAQRGHRVSFLSTTRNIQRLPPIPQALAHLITQVSLPFNHHHHLPPNAESCHDISSQKHQLLKDVFHSVQPTIASFLSSSHPRPDCVLFDLNSHWLPGLARRLGIRSAYFGLYNAAVLAYVGPPSVLIDVGSGKGKSTLQDFTTIPNWIPFKSANVKLRPYEVAKLVQRQQDYEMWTNNKLMFGVTLRDSDFVAIRTCPEFEPKWFDLLGKLYQKPLVPIGFLPPTMTGDDEKDGEQGASIWEWLDKQTQSSVVYVALGSEFEPSVEEVQRMALGLEKTGLPFLWALRNLPESTQRAQDMLPDGFEERVDGRGMVWTEWAPQVRILSHGSVGGFLTHCGYNSIIEGLSFGRVLILLPMINDQGLNASLLQGKNLGVEVERDERDGSFTPDSVAEAVTLAMVGEAGEPLRAAAKEAMDLFGNQKKNDRYVDEFVCYLEEHI